MSKRVSIELELPNEVWDLLGGQDVASTLKEALIMQLLREGHISQGKAAHLLGMNRWDFFPLMAKYQIPFITEEELDKDLNKLFPQQ
jgi:predicted HTH domain antitoxin